MYTITEEQKVDTLPEDYDETKHISVYLLNNSVEPTDAAKKEVYTIFRGNTSGMVLFKVNDTPVWSNLSEFQVWDKILSKLTNQNRVYYVAGGSTTSYELHILYNN